MIPMLYSLTELQEIIARESILMDIHMKRSAAAQSEELAIVEFLIFLEHDQIRDAAMSEFDKHVTKN